MGSLAVYNSLVKPATELSSKPAQRPPIQFKDPTPTLPKDQLNIQPPSSGQPADQVRFFFVSDNHSRTKLLEQLIDLANHEDPDLIIDGGDFTHDGTEAEIKRAYALREKFESPVKMVTGNHDAHLRGPFKEPPPQLPDFQAFDLKGTRFILLDNEDETITEAQFQKLEADLKTQRQAHPNKPIFLAMHVPPKLSKTPLSVKLGKYIPGNLASPMMREPEQVKRLHQLMKEHGVKAVLAGHTHYADELVEDGVRYVTAGSSGGLSPKPGLPKEFLDIRVNQGGEVDIQRVTLKPGTGVVKYVGEAIDFYRDLNSYNHATVGWKDFYPSANLGYNVGFRRVETEKGASVAATVSGMAERLVGEKGSVFGTVGVSAGTGDLVDIGLQTEVGYRHAIVGDYNKGVYLSGAGTANVGYLHGGVSGGVGAKAAVGVQYKNWRVELGQEWSTNYKAQTLTAGFRF